MKSFLFKYKCKLLAVVSMITLTSLLDIYLAFIFKNLLLLRSP
ncbi:UNVERIFIED_CONTAM: hypothetical protein ABIC26_001521 [Paenibacillus sp. PvR008]